jgi:hypothetical protein
MVQVNVDANGTSSTSDNSGLAQLGRRLGDVVRAVIVDEKRPGGMLAA